MPSWFSRSKVSGHGIIPYQQNTVGIPIEGCDGRYCSALANPVFPTPLYEAFVCIALFFVLWSLRKHIKIPGTLFSLYLMFNGMERFFIEKIRVNNTYDIFGNKITQAEIIAVILFILGSLSIFYFRTSR